jgi:hypothetical protein
MLRQSERKSSLLNILNLHTTPIPNISPPWPRTQKCCQAREMTIIYGHNNYHTTVFSTTWAGRGEVFSHHLPRGHPRRLDDDELTTTNCVALVEDFLTDMLNKSANTAIKQGQIEIVVRSRRFFSLRIFT